MTQPDLVIFDCDGVLVDSEIIAARVEADLLTAPVLRYRPRRCAETLCRPDLQGHHAEDRGEGGDPLPGLADRVRPRSLSTAS
jgi:beta-phosphoglucomutase-like phosphatase (HAD superfamily)